MNDQPITQEEIVIGYMRNTINELPLEDKEKVIECYNTLKNTVTETGPYGFVALGLLGAEMAAGKLE
jgi:hypothetical protein